MIVPLGLLSWLAAGLVAVLLAWQLLPGQPGLSLAAALLAGPWGALAGGMIATVLGFGGLVSFDRRSLVIAALTAVLTLLVLRSVQLTIRLRR